MPESHSKTFTQRFTCLIGLVVIMWVVHVFNLISADWLYRFGLVPREIAGLDGLLGAPFLHANFQHLASNTLGLTALGGLVSLQGNRTFVRVTLVIAFVGGLATWLLAQYAIHIGASG
ncbi:MAG: rhomboid family intramembrane serine protease, partial [Gammaproteobacteria bacterium]|nr:rhomboid family intramembrane serine protease [Gammaproteobacteria bacterium]